RLRRLDGAAYAHLRGVMADDLRPLLREDGVELGVADVEAIPAGAAMDIVASARGEIIHDRDVVARGDEGVDDVGADEARARRGSDSHGIPRVRHRPGGRPAIAGVGS